METSVASQTYKVVKNPNWWKADQLAIYKCGPGIEAQDHWVTNPA